MGHVSKNYITKDDEKKKYRQDMEVFRKLEQFYKDHPYATQRTKAEVDGIRRQFDGAVKGLQEKFETEHQVLTTKYLQMELEYLESWISPEEKVEKSLVQGSWFAKVFRWLGTIRP